MKQSLSNKRMRNRSRKSGGSLNKSYESNGPDVKVRGTAHHIAEKYVSLSRDALSAGDMVMAENYLQHAEHYFRIIASAQAQLPQSHSTKDDEQGKNAPHASAKVNGHLKDNEAPGLGEQPTVNGEFNQVTSATKEDTGAVNNIKTASVNPANEINDTETAAEETTTEKRPPRRRRRSVPGETATTRRRGRPAKSETVEATDDKPLEAKAVTDQPLQEVASD